MEKELTYKDVPFFGQVEGYGPQDGWMTEKEWNSLGYSIKNSLYNKGTSMRPAENAKEMEQYFSKRDVFCPLTKSINLMLGEKLRKMGGYSQYNKFVALTEILEGKKTYFKEAFGSAIDFISLFEKNVATQFGRNDIDTAAIAEYFCNIVFDEDNCYYGEHNHHLSLLRGWNIPKQFYTLKLLRKMSR